MVEFDHCSHKIVWLSHEDKIIFVQMIQNKQLWQVLQLLMLDSIHSIMTTFLHFCLFVYKHQEFPKIG